MFANWPNSKQLISEISDIRPVSLIMSPNKQLHNDSVHFTHSSSEKNICIFKQPKHRCRTNLACTRMCSCVISLLKSKHGGCSVTTEPKSSGQ